MKPFFTQNTDIICKPTLEQLAYMVAHLDHKDHATLISLIAGITQSPDYSQAMQLQYITESPHLTPAGRSLMSAIGDYAQPLPTSHEVE